MIFKTPVILEKETEVLGQIDEVRTRLNYALKTPSGVMVVCVNLLGDENGDDSA